MVSHAREDELPTVTRIGAARGARGEFANIAANGAAGQCTPVRSAERGRSRPALVIIERRVLIRECLARCLKDSKKNDVIRSYSNVEEWLDERPYSSLHPIIVLCSAERTEAEVERDVALLSQAVADVYIVILSDREDASSVLKALDKGARGYITTSMAFDVAVQAIRLVRRGAHSCQRTLSSQRENSIEKLPLASENPWKGHFTARQLTVVESLRQGKTNKAIAYELNMCESTVKVHVRHIMKKLGVKSRAEVAFLMIGVGGKACTGDLVNAKPFSL